MFEEQALFAFRERHGCEGVILRLFGGYGPRQNITWWGGPQSVFIAAALKGEALELHGTGQQTRSFTYVVGHGGGLRARGGRAGSGRRDAQHRRRPRDHDRGPGPHGVGHGPRRRAAPGEGAAGHLRDATKTCSAGSRTTGGRRASWATRRASRSRRGCRARSPGSAKPWRAPASCDPRRGARLQRGGQHARPCSPPSRSASSPWPCAIASSWSTTAPPTAPRSACARRRRRGAARGGRVGTIANRGPGAAFRTGFLHVLETAAPLDLVVTLEGDQTSDAERPPAPAPPRLGGGRSHRARLLLPVRRRHQGHEPASRRPQPRRERPHEEGSRPERPGHPEQLLPGVPGLCAAWLCAQRYGDDFITTRGFECMVEILYRAARLGLRISEVPMVLDGSRRVGKSKMKVLPNVGRLPRPGPARPHRTTLSRRESRTSKFQSVQIDGGRRLLWSNIPGSASTARIFPS